MGFLFSKDKNWIYERGMKIRNVDYTSFQTLKDSKVLPFLKNYYFKRYCGIDNLNFYVFSTSYTDEIFTEPLYTIPLNDMEYPICIDSAKEKYLICSGKATYLFNGNIHLTQIDPKDFKILNPFYVVSRNKLFYNGIEITSYNTSPYDPGVMQPYKVPEMELVLLGAVKTEKELQYERELSIIRNTKNVSVYRTYGQSKYFTNGLNVFIIGYPLHKVCAYTKSFKIHSEYHSFATNGTINYYNGNKIEKENPLYETVLALFSNKPLDSDIKKLANELTESYSR